MTSEFLSPNDLVDRLFLMLLRARWHPSALAEARAFVDGGSIAWEQFLARAGERSLAPLIYDVSRGLFVVPPAVERSLQAAYVRNAARSTLIFATLEEFLRRCRTAGANIVLLKGAALAATIYGNAALRPMMDIDLMVDQKTVNAVVQQLAEMGFYASHDEPRPGSHLAFESQMRFQRDDSTRTLIEVHWGLFDSPYYQALDDMAWWRQSTREALVGNSSILVLGPEAQILHLCAHMSLHHHALVWLWLHDIAELIFHYENEIDWTELFTQARGMNLLMPLQQVLPQVIANWQPPVPVELVEELRLLSPQSQELRIHHLFTQQRRTVAHHFIADLVGLRTWEQRITYALTQIFPSAKYMQVRYQIEPPLLTSLYYPLRWFSGLASLWQFRRQQSTSRHAKHAD
ncbi:MAG: nucleotidyltransferase family protein [Caldilineales bacterium]|nr:nucleotidyltransferase family protein [Caldilineales bacterium]